MSDKMHISWNEYQNIIETLEETLEVFKQEGIKFHFVSIYRGSLLMGQHLSNVMNSPLSIVKFQRLDGNDEEVEFIYNAGISPREVIVILDDIYDTGKTLNKVKDYFITKYKKNITQAFTLTWNNNINEETPDWVTSDLKTNGKWVVFPWEK